MYIALTILVTLVYLMFIIVKTYLIGKTEMKLIVGKHFKREINRSNIIVGRICLIIFLVCTLIFVYRFIGKPFESTKEAQFLAVFYYFSFLLSLKIYLDMKSTMKFRKFGVSFSYMLIKYADIDSISVEGKRLTIIQKNRVLVFRIFDTPTELIEKEIIKHLHV